MADLRLSFAMTPYDRMLPLINGEVKPDGITLEYQGMPGGISRVHYEGYKFKRYDVSESGLSPFFRLRPMGWPYRMLPVFHNRNFSYVYILVRKSSGIRQGHPEDLKGKRIGVADYQQSRGVWVRGVLQMEFGIKPEDMVWYQEHGEHFSQTGAVAEAGFPLPSTVRLNYAKADFATMYLKGELDASLGNPDISLGGRGGRAYDSGLSRVPASGIHHGRASVADNPDIVTLFPDPRQEAIRFFKKTGVFPPHHATIIRERIVEEHPWVATSLMEAFEESKRIAIERLRQSPPTLMVFGQHYLKELDEIFGPDPYAYGIKANAKSIEMVQTFSVEQGLAECKLTLDEIFPREVILREERMP